MATARFASTEGCLWQVMPETFPGVRDELVELAGEFVERAPWMGVKRASDLVAFFKVCAEESGYLLWVAENDKELIGFCTMSLDEQIIGHDRQVTIHTCYMRPEAPHRGMVATLNDIATAWGKQHGATEVHMASGAGEKWAPRHGFEVESTNWKRSI